jgi:hypothetical protein
MTIKSADKKQLILAELEELDMEGLGETLAMLDNYTITPPSPADKDHLLACLTPVLEKQNSDKNLATSKQRTLCQECYERLQLVAAQTKLLSRWFIILSAVILLSGLSVINALDGDTLRFMANAAPLLGILTILYQFRANYNHMTELEASCPYTPAQLASARLLAVLAYDILLCLAASLFANFENYVLWQVVAHWLAPLLLTLGIALLASLQFGILGGCLLSTVAWALNVTFSKNGKSLFSVLLPHISIIYLDFLSASLGLLLLIYFFKRLDTAAWHSKNQHIRRPSC